MQTDDRLASATDDRHIPFAMLLARQCVHDVEAIIRRDDGLTYDALRQVNLYSQGPLTMGASTCFRRSSTGLIFTDNDRAQDD